MNKIQFIQFLAISILTITCSNPVENEDPKLSTNTTSFNFTKNSNQQTLLISNMGKGDLSWEINQKPAWLLLSKSNGNVASGQDTVIVTANLELGPGEYEGSMKIESNGGNLDINISFNITIWVKKADIPTARIAHAVVTLYGQLYAVGGFHMVNNNEVQFSSVESYDPVTDSWIVKGSLINRRSHLACCNLNGKIYAIGGWSDYRGKSNVEIFDPGTNTWASKSSLPKARWGHDVAVVDGKIYAIGGAYDWPITEYSLSIEEYNPGTDTWTTKSTIPSRRWGLSCSVVDGKIYAIGGCDNNNGLSVVEEYDPALNTWTTKTSMPTARFAFFTAVVNGKIYAINGAQNYPPSTLLTTVEEYDPTTDTWTTKTPAPLGRIAIGGSSLSINGKIYIVGGRGNELEDIYSDTYEYDPGFDY